LILDLISAKVTPKDGCKTIFGPKENYKPLYSTFSEMTSGILTPAILSNSALSQ
jgi:hypothetical protein